MMQVSGCWADSELGYPESKNCGTYSKSMSVCYEQILRQSKIITSNSSKSVEGFRHRIFKNHL